MKSIKHYLLSDNIKVYMGSGTGTGNPAPGTCTSSSHVEGGCSGNKSKSEEHDPNKCGGPAYARKNN